MKKPRLARFSLIALGGSLLLTSALRAETQSSSSVAFSDRGKPGTLKINLAAGSVRIRGVGGDITVKADAQSAPAFHLQLTEKDNVAVLEAAGRNDGIFEISAPRNTTVVIANHLNGSIHVRDLTGDVEINNKNGGIQLDNLTGGALVETMNGKISASFEGLPSDKPLFFASMNGEVLVSVPADARANVRLRTQNGSIRNGFEGKAFVPQTVAGVATPTSAIPPMTGGRLAAGSINGGGTEISIATVNGNVSLQQLGIPRPDRRVSIQFENPEKYSDVRYSLGTDEGRSVVLDEIRDYFTKRAETLLPTGYGLSVNFTDIDLAGDYYGRDIRKVDQMHPPAMKFTYAFTNPAGEVVKQGDARLRDVFFLLYNPLHSRSLFPHEEALLNEWLEKSVRALNKS